MSHRDLATAVLAAGALAASSASGEVIRPSVSAVELRPGDIVGVLWFLEASQTPFVGYSLEFDITSPSLAEKSSGAGIGIDESASSFFDVRNVISAGGSSRSDLFSAITELPDGGTLFTTTTVDFSEVLATPTVNDVLAFTLIVVDRDANLGRYDISLGNATALSDSAGFGIDFDAQGLRIDVVPAPGPTVLIAAAAGVAVARRRREARQSR